MTCDSCKQEVSRIRNISAGLWACLGCYQAPPKELKMAIIKKIRLGSQMATENQLKELGRRRILPYKKEGGGYYLGRMGENGKVEERWPDYA